MVYPNHQLWGLAVSAVINQIDGAHHDGIGGWGPGDKTVQWCTNLLSDYYGVDSRESCLKMLKYYFTEGHTAEVRIIVAHLPALKEHDSPKQRIVRDASLQIEKHGLTAWDMARAVMTAGRGFWAGYLGEAEAWQVIMTAATNVQKTFTSWRTFGVNYELGRLFWSGGGAHEPTAKAIDFLFNDPSSPWNTLPFDLALDADIITAADEL